MGIKPSGLGDRLKSRQNDVRAEEGDRWPFELGGDAGSGFDFAVREVGILVFGRKPLDRRRLARVFGLRLRDLARARLGSEASPSSSSPSWIDWGEVVRFAALEWVIGAK